MAIDIDMIMLLLLLISIILLVKSNSDSNELKAIIHIGAHKTGSTHIQSYLANNTLLIESNNYAFPTHPDGTYFTLADINNHLHRNFLPDFRPKLNYNGQLSIYLDRAYNSKKNVIISETDFDMLTLNEIKFFRELLKNFPKVTIIIVYREILSHLISEYGSSSSNFIVLPSSSTYLLNRIRVVSDMWDGYVQKWGSVFGSKNIKLIDYYGVLAADKDEAYVIVCEIAGILCDRASELNNDNAAHENAATHYHYEVYHLLCFVAQVSNGCKPPSGLNMRRMMTTIEHSLKHTDKPLPVKTVSLESMHSYAKEIDTIFRERYTDLFMYSNVTANDEARKKTKVTELQMREMQTDSYWVSWMHHEIVKLKEMGFFTHCDSPDSNL